MGQWDLHSERPGTIDEKGRRVIVHPSEVHGVWQKRRKVAQAILVMIFLVLPWIRIGGSQALLLDVSQRHFDIFGLHLRAHNAPLMFFVLAIVGFGLFFVTAVWGRIWCGWACPQTVFIDGVFRRVEHWIEGPATARRTLEKAPWTLNKIARKTLKWILFTLFSLVLTHSFLAYFVGTEQLAQMVTHLPSENRTSFLFMVLSTAIILFDFGWLREQFCLIVCPYGRFQSVLMDSRSMIVGYDEQRGEPRRGSSTSVNASMPMGDCVNCYRCVQVCPTGIDIRRGVQMECIACTACIDACDDVMTKTKKPTGLIRYATLSELRTPKLDVASRAQRRPRFTFDIRGPTGIRRSIYLAVILGSATALAFAVIRHEDLDVQVIRGRGLPYQEVAGSLPNQPKLLLNQFYAEITNTAASDVEVTVTPRLPDGTAADDIEIVTSLKVMKARAGKTERIGFFIKFPRERKRIVLQFETLNHDKIVVQREVTLAGPL